MVSAKRVILGPLDVQVDLTPIATKMITVGQESFVRFTIQSVDSGKMAGVKIYVYDHRPLTWNTLKEMQDKTQIRTLEPGDPIDELDALRRPARITVVEQTSERGRVFYHINLWDTYPKNPEHRLSQIALTGNHLAPFAILEDNALWSDYSTSTSKDGRNWKTIWVVVTSDHHDFIIRKALDPNNPPENEVVLIGSGVYEMTMAEYNAPMNDDEIDAMIDEEAEYLSQKAEERIYGPK